MKKPPSPIAAGAAVAAAVLLAACGGGGSDSGAAAEDPAEVPRSATSSIAAWFGFVRSLPATDTGEALRLTNAGEPPVSDTEEPMALPR